MYYIWVLILPQLLEIKKYNPNVLYMGINS